MALQPLRGSHVASRCKDRAPRRLASALVVALALAGCGSTVQMQATSPLAADGLGSGTAAGGTAGGSGPGVSPLVGAGSVGPSSGSLAVSGPGAVPGGTAGQPGPVGGSYSSTTLPGAPANAPVRIGVIYASGVAQLAAAMGIPGLSTGDTKAQASAVFAWINSHGGLAGHRVQGYFFDATKSGASNPDGSMAVACAALVQDDHVRFVESIATMPLSGLTCFAHAGVGVLDDETTLGDATMAKYASALGNPGEIAQGRMKTVMVPDLWQRGWLTPTSKVGILSADAPDAHAVVDNYLKPALKQYGLTAASTQYVDPNGGDGGSSQSSSAALQFRAMGVDRIISVEYSPLFVMDTASSQQYHPAYALTSDLGPGALLETAAPPDQLVNAAGIGWQPYLDIGKGTKPGPVSSRETLCFSIMAAAGQASSAATTKGFEAQVCNVLFYLKDLSDLSLGVPQGLLTSGRALLKDRYVSADTFRTDVTHRTDGVAGFRDLAYQQDCTCFQYVSGVKATP